MIITIYNQTSKEVFACINTDNNESFIEKGFAVDVRNTEPAFNEKDGKLLFNENQFIIKI